MASKIGHPSSDVLSSLSRKGGVIASLVVDLCVSCYVGKSCKLNFVHAMFLHFEPLELIEVDLWGPAPLPSKGHTYYMSIVYIATQYTWIYFLQKKSDATKVFIEFHSNVEQQLGHLLKAIQIDGGGEFKTLAPYLVQHGHNHRVILPYTSEDNGYS